MPYQHVPTDPIHDRSPFVLPGRMQTSHSIDTVLKAYVYIETLNKLKVTLHLEKSANFPTETGNAG